MRRYVTCQKCGHRNDRTGGRRKCVNCREALPKRRVPKHAGVLRDTSYEKWASLSVAIHGGDKDACAMCRRPKPDTGNHERDHDHRTGLARGLLCYRCNHQLARNHTLETARALVAYLERSEAFDVASCYTKAGAA